MIQFSLYYNGYKDIIFNGKYDDLTIDSITKFQNFMQLEETNYCNIDTIMSLFISKGNPERKSIACDCSIKLNDDKAKMLYNEGYRFVGRYLTNVQGGRDKKMDLAEFKTILNSGLKVFLIFQEGTEKKEHFTTGSGEIDCNKAINAAEELKVPYNSVIYFAVDCDLMDFEVKELIIPYFTEVKETMMKLGNKYKIGIYGSRNMCIKTASRDLTVFSFVSDMSTGYSGNLGYPMPKNWSFDQFCEYKFNNSFSLDKDACSGKDLGISYIRSEDDEQYNRIAAINYAKKWYNSFNSKFFDCSKPGGDCANFVSQCINAGGLEMNKDWNSKKPIECLNKLRNKFSTPSFVNAKKHYEYFCNNYRNGDIKEIRNKNEIADIIEECKKENNPIRLGDLLYFGYNSGIYHCTIISDVEPTMIKFAAHTDSAFDKPLNQTQIGESDIKNGPIYAKIVRIKF